MSAVFLWIMAACSPMDEIVDSTADRYMEQRPGPDALIDENGRYAGGWYTNFDGVINPEDSVGADNAFKGWLHFNLANEDYSVTGHLADLRTAGNATLSVVSLETGEVWSESTREAFGENRMVIADDFSEIRNENDGSYLRVSEDGLSVDIDIRAHEMRFEGTLQSTGADRFIQVTRYHDGYGILQWFEQVEVVEARLTLQDGSCIELPAGMRGTTDRMAGHRRTHQNWNWIAGAGTAIRESDGAEVTIAMSMSEDQEGARPQVDAQKYAVWVDSDLYKISSLEFDYTVLDETTRETSDWTIYSDADDANGVDLVFVPLAQRRDLAGYLWFYFTDYNAYIGELTGTVRIEGETYVLDPMITIVEDALLTL